MIVPIRFHQAVAEKGLSLNGIRDMGYPNVYAYVRKFPTRILPSPKDMRSLCDMLDCSADWLLGLSDERKLHRPFAKESVPDLFPQIERLRSEKRNAPYEKKTNNAYYRLKASYRRGDTVRMTSYVRAAEDYGVSVDELLGLR